MQHKIILFFCLFLILTHFVFAQDQKKVVRELSPKKGWWRETYFVIGNDSTKNGEYIFTHHGHLETKGYYKNGRKDSVWEFFGDSKRLTSRNFYQDSEKTGIWEFYDNSGSLSWTYDFTTSTISYLVPPNHENNTYGFQNEGGRWIKGNPDKLPILLKSQAQWMHFLVTNLIYPEEVIKGKPIREGKVGIGVFVDEKGEIIKYEIAQSADPLLDEEALRAVKLFDPMFVPAENKGKKVKSAYIMYITFRLESQ